MNSDDSINEHWSTRKIKGLVNDQDGVLDARIYSGHAL